MFFPFTGQLQYVNKVVFKRNRDLGGNRRPGGNPGGMPNTPKPPQALKAQPPVPRAQPQALRAQPPVLRAHPQALRAQKGLPKAPGNVIPKPPMELRAQKMALRAQKRELRAQKMAL